MPEACQTWHCYATPRPHHAGRHWTSPTRNSAMLFSARAAPSMPCLWVTSPHIAVALRGLAMPPRTSHCYAFAVIAMLRRCIPYSTKPLQTLPNSTMHCNAFAVPTALHLHHELRRHHGTMQCRSGVFRSCARGVRNGAVPVLHISGQSCTCAVRWETTPCRRNAAFHIAVPPRTSQNSAITLIAWLLRCRATRNNTEAELFHTLP